MLTKLLEDLSSLDLPYWKYAIFGSGPLAIRWLRESNDLDIIVTQDLWDDLTLRFPESIHQKPTEEIQIGAIEVFRSWLTLTPKIEEMITTAESIGGFPFVQLPYVIEWKQMMGREKDKRDLDLIDKWNQEVQF